jgi:hypothetical protein
LRHLIIGHCKKFPIGSGRGKQVIPRPDFRSCNRRAKRRSFSQRAGNFFSGPWGTVSLVAILAAWSRTKLNTAKHLASNGRSKPKTAKVSERPWSVKPQSRRLASE